VRIGLNIPQFTWAGGDAVIGSKLAEIARTADEVGFDLISVMDHLFQIHFQGPPELPMLEAYTTLGFLAGHTDRAKLMTLVTGAIYRYPGILAKQVTTLDVLSGGRAWLGIGAGWDEEEALGLGIPFPPLTDRFEQLEEAVQICLQMWSGDDSPYRGKHFHLERTLNSPQALTKPHPPIMIGGSGEQKTLRLVAKYAQACNVGADTDVPHKMAVLREHCEREGREFDQIQKTAGIAFDLGARGERIDATLTLLQDLAGQGIDTVIGSVAGAESITPLKLMGSEVIPAAARF
jgi:F420-dependent oxidoreductase-like protein